MEEKILSIHPSRLARKMAKAQLDRRGATGYNKPTTLLNGKVGPSVIAQHWKAFAVEASKFTRSKKKGAKK